MPIIIKKYAYFVLDLSIFSGVMPCVRCVCCCSGSTRANPAVTTTQAQRSIVSNHAVGTTSEKEFKNHCLIQG